MWKEVVDKQRNREYTLNVKLFYKNKKGDNKMLEKVIEIIQEQLNLEGVTITEESSFKDDLGADSLDLLNWLWR